MTTPLAINPRNATYLSRTPYLTVQEYLNAPTAVDTSQLIPGGTTGQQTQALTDVIARASSFADLLCYQVLAPTTETEVSKVRISNDAYVAIKCKYWPILEVDSISLGPRPDMLTSLVAASDGPLIQIIDPIVYAPAWSSGTTTSPSFTIPPLLFLGDLAWVQITYVCGWPNTTLTATANSGQNQISVTNALGLYGSPIGTPLTVYDGIGTEQVVVQSVSGNTVTLTANLQSTHLAGTSVSALPPAVKEAVILLTSFTIKTRGAEAVVMASVAGPPRHTAPMEAGGFDDLGVAAELLAPYRRVA